MVATIGLFIGCVSLILTGILGFYAIYLAKKGNRYATEAKELGQQAVELSKTAKFLINKIEEIHKKENEEALFLK